jgi:hypothetical protein
MSMADLLLQNMPVLVIGTFNSLRAFVNQIHYIVANTRAIYSALNVDIATHFYFLDCQKLSNC